MTRPLHERRGDWVSVVGFAAFAVSTFTVDVAAVTGWMHGDNAFADLLRGYTEAADPLFGAMPFYVKVLMVISVVFFGPMDVALVHAFVRGNDAIRLPALVFAGAQTTAMLTYFGFELLGPLPPRNWLLVTAANAPYVLLPLALVWRFRRARPFASSRHARAR